MGSVSPVLRPGPKNLFDEINAIIKEAQKSGAVIDLQSAADRVLAKTAEAGLSREQIVRAMFERCTHMTGIGLVLRTPEASGEPIGKGQELN